MAVLALVAATVLSLGVSGAALGAWSTSGSGGASLAAGNVDKPAAPTVTKSGSTAVISWTATTMSDSTTSVSAYRVLRHSGSTTTTICTVSAPTVTCTDSSPLVGVATYGVVATYKTNWVSVESDPTTFAIDATPPVTTGTWSGTQTNGWVKAASSTVSLTATDTGGSGVASITYKIGNGSPVTVTGASTSFAVSTQGATTVTYFATDVAGNVESDKTLVVQLDNLAPSVAVTFPVANGGPYTSGTWGTKCRNASNTAIAGICGTASDTGSGLSTVMYRIEHPVSFGQGIQCWNGTNWTFGACNTPWRATAGGPTSGSWVIPMSYTDLGTGPFNLYIQATDVATNVNDTTNPVLSWN